MQDFYISETRQFEVDDCMTSYLMPPARSKQAKPSGKTRAQKAAKLLTEQICRSDRAENVILVEH
jgi:hypothetical protein